MSATSPTVSKRSAKGLLPVESATASLTGISSPPPDRTRSVLLIPRPELSPSPRDSVSLRETPARPLPSRGLRPFLKRPFRSDLQSLLCRISQVRLLPAAPIRLPLRPGHGGWDRLREIIRRSKDRSLEGPPGGPYDRLLFWYPRGKWAYHEKRNELEDRVRFPLASPAGGSNPSRGA